MSVTSLFGEGIGAVYERLRADLFLKGLISLPGAGEKARAAAKASAAVSDSWLKAVRARPRESRITYQHADGRLEKLDRHRRNEWSAEAREAVEMCERADRQRRHRNGYLISDPCCEPVRLRE